MLYSYFHIKVVRGIYYKHSSNVAWKLAVKEVNRCCLCIIQPANLLLLVAGQITKFVAGSTLRSSSIFFYRDIILQNYYLL